MPKLLRQVGFLFKLNRSSEIARRYFVVNGFDGALTMLGMVTGFYVADETNASVILSACLGAAIALGMSGLSSAYISEAAERRRELQELEAAMITDLGAAAHGQAARLIPLLIALVNGCTPLLVGLLTISPIWVSTQAPLQTSGALQLSMTIAFVIIFLFGMLLGRVSNTFWLVSGLRTLLVGAATCLLILLFSW